jgi:spore coat polysaccharide biosynthesis protein SpsF
VPGGLVVAIQARTGSSRAPRKVLADLAGRPMLRFQLDRLRTLDCEHLVVATSDLPADDPVAELAAHAGVAVVRGSEADVLGRFGAVLEQYDPVTVVRLTGDCPFTDPSIVTDVVALHHRAAADYTSNVHPRSFPKGLDVEVVRAGALAEAVAEATDPYEREHVTPFLYRHPERYAMANLDSGQALGELRWTVDTPEDLAHVRELAALVDDPVAASWIDLLTAARAAGLTG